MNGQRATSACRIMGHLCAWVVAGFFLYAAYGKIGGNNTRQFAVEVKNYKIMPERYVNLPAIFLPWLEVAAAVALIFPRTRPAGAILISAMLLAFIASVGYSALYLGLDISCGCTGKDSGQAGWSTIGRNVALIIAVLLSVWLSRYRFPLGQCRQCGYDLKGSVSDRCSECGMPFEQSESLTPA